MIQESQKLREALESARNEMRSGRRIAVMEKIFEDALSSPSPEVERTNEEIAKELLSKIFYGKWVGVPADMANLHTIKEALDAKDALLGESNLKLLACETACKKLQEEISTLKEENRQLWLLKDLPENAPLKIKTLFGKEFKHWIELEKENSELREENYHMLKTWMPGHSCKEEHDRLSSKLQVAVGGLQKIINELGVPQPDYPAPVTNAVNIAQSTLKQIKEGE